MSSGICSRRARDWRAIPAIRLRSTARLSNPLAPHLAKLRTARAATGIGADLVLLLSKLSDLERTIGGKLMSKARIVEAVELGSRTSPRRSPSSLLTHVEVGGLSHVGRVRATNEDHFLVARFDRQMSAMLTNLPAGLIPDRYADAAYGFLVADGMGGQAGGEVA